MEISKETMKKLMLLITFTVLLLVGVQHLDIVLGSLRMLWCIIFPLVLGGAVAFVLNVPMHFLEDKLFACAKKKKKISPTLARGFSLLLTFALLILVILLLVLVIVPQLAESISSLGSYIATAVLRAVDWAEKQFAAYPDIVQRLENLTFDWGSLLENLWTFLTNGVGSMVTSTISMARSIFGAVTTGFIAFIFAVYLLLQKDRLGLQCRKALYALVPQKSGDQVIRICALSHRVFSSFISGQCMEAVILGSMFFLSMVLLQMPYALLTGCLIAVTALIPIVGAFIGCIVGALLLLMVSPVQAAFFVVLFLVLQQIEGNLIYPHVVGNSVGLPSIWVLAAVSVGGSLMGVAGMILFIPLTSIVYTLFREFVYKRLKEKRIRVK